MEKRKFAILLAIVSVAFVALFFMSCGGSGPDDPLPVVKPSPTLKISDARLITTTGATFDIEVSNVSSGFTESGVIIDGSTQKNEPVSSSNFTISVGLLSSNATHTIKAYAKVPEGTAYSAEKSFKTNEVLAKIKDYDGNEYDVVKIGTQTWTVQDWKCTHYRDGSVITYATENVEWKNRQSGARCIYAHDPKFPIVLYNWFAATDPRGLAPVGWHVATDRDWDNLPSGLDHTKWGNALKEVGKTHWLGENSLATNSTGFTAIPTGYRNGDGNFAEIGMEARWIRIQDNFNDQYMSLRYDSEKSIGFSGGSGNGNAVRLVKDY